MTLGITKFLESLKKHEGLRLKPYRDTVGKLTIGYGRNLDDKGITEAEAEALLENDAMLVIAQVKNALPWVADLDIVRQNVLYEMAFNMGLAGLLGFSGTLQAVSAGRYVDASKRMLRSKWATQVKGRAVTLSEMMRSGKFPG